MTDRVTIALEGIELWGHCGVSVEERFVGQRIIVDVRLLQPTTKALASDELADTIDYGVVTALVDAAVERAEYKLIEHLASVIADDLLAELPVDEVLVTVRKPAPPVGLPVTAAFVELARQR
jgi:dihydroneopterin aldolase